MKENCRVVLRGGAGEITEKKSRFIADVRPVASEEEALAFVEEMRKKYWDGILMRRQKILDSCPTAER